MPAENKDNPTESATNRCPRWVTFGGVLVLLAVVAWAVILGPSTINSRCLSLARSRMEQFEYTRALKSLEFAESLGVDDHETHFLKARIYRKTGRFNLFEESLGKAGSKGLPKTKIENEKLLLRGQSGNLRELLDELENLAGGVDQFDPREVYEAIVNGFLLYGRFMDANLYVQNWEKDFPTDPRQRFYRAILLIRFGPIQKIQGAQEKAASILDKLTSEYPNYFQAAMTYGDLLFNLNRIEDAVPQFERCRQHPDAGIQPTLSLARCYANLGQQQKAKALFREVLEREPANDFARAELGKLQYNDEEFEEARANLEAAYPNRKWDFDLVNSLARTLRAPEDQQRRKKLLERANLIREKLAIAQDLMAAIEVRDDEEKRFQLGMILLEYSDPETGVIYLSSILEKNPAHPRARAALRKYYQSKSLATPNQNLPDRPSANRSNL